jgi:hypothetical protein
MRRVTLFGGAGLVTRMKSGRTVSTELVAARMEGLVEADRMLLFRWERAALSE